MPIMTPSEVSLPPEVRPLPWPPQWPAIGEALQGAWSDGSWGRYDGPHCQRLVERLQQLHDLPWIYLCASGTCAVELALRGVGVQAGDEVVLAGYDYPGNFRAIEAVGARPVLVDVQPGRWTMDLGQLEQVLGNSRISAVVVSHLHGELLPGQEMSDLCQRFGVPWIEDACQAPGAWIGGRRVGTWADAGVLSFGGSKLLTAGRGGAVLTRHQSVWQRIKIFAERGNAAFPLSELQAAVLLPQLDRLDEQNQTRCRQALLWKTTLETELGWQVARWADGTCPSFYKLGVQPGAMPAEEFENWLMSARRWGFPWGAGFRGFARRTTRRCRQAFALVHSQTAADRTILIDHTHLAASPAAVINFLRQSMKNSTVIDS
ncbi:MAG: hypothetical protein KatS3mg109_1401 [Pirellulaceae bacterium]|nr:MAG: hypothetical protein KatS3mg109_1401 [Pirellulaceae bacterium]